MEIHPILECDTVPQKGIWYVVSGFGSNPSMRVGHTCTFVPSTTGRGKIYFMGGANPDGPFGDVHILDLDTFSWDTCDSEGFKARYEHAMFIPESEPNNIYVYGGAEQGTNLNDMQVYDIEKKSWDSVDVQGTPPSPRTYHSCTHVGDKFYVFSGGQSGSDPVNDRHVYCFDVKTKSWTKLQTQGDSPKARHGHVVAVVKSKLVVHGGMARNSFFDDLHILDLKTLTWKYIRNRGTFPCKRTAHNFAVNGNYMYVLGGMSQEGALDDTYRLDTETMKWCKMEIFGPPPASRLDYASCWVSLKVEVPELDAVAKEEQNELEQNMQNLQVQSTTHEGEEAVAVEGAAAAEITKELPIWIINGGMDTEGNIFDDTLAMILE